MENNVYAICDSGNQIAVEDIAFDNLDFARWYCLCQILAAAADKIVEYDDLLYTLVDQLIGNM